MADIITVNKTRKNFKDVTIETESGSFKWTVPISFDDAKISKGIRKELYPDAVGNTLAEIGQWIVDNPDVEPVPWKSTHPKEASNEYQEAMLEFEDSIFNGKNLVELDGLVDDATSDPDMAFFLKKLLRRMKSLEDLVYVVK